MHIDVEGLYDLKSGDAGLKPRSGVVTDVVVCGGVEISGGVTRHVL